LDWQTLSFLTLAIILEIEGSSVLTSNILSQAGRRRLQYSFLMGICAMIVAGAIFELALALFPALLYIVPEPSTDAALTGLPWALGLAIICGPIWGFIVWVRLLRSAANPINTASQLNSPPPNDGSLVADDAHRNWAIFVDVSNVALGENNTVDLSPGELDRALDWVERTHENALIKQAYGDYSAAMHGGSELGVELRRHGFMLAHMPRLQRGSEKNHSDIQLAVDVSLIARSRPDIHGYVILGGDGDYTPLVLQLRSLGKIVEIIGREKTTASSLIMQANAFTAIEAIIGRDTMNPASLRQAETTLRAALTGLASQGIVMPIYALPALLKSTGVDVTALGFSDVMFFQKVMVELGVLRRSVTPAGDIIMPGSVEPGKDTLDQLLHALGNSVIEFEKRKQHPSLSQALESIWKANAQLDVTRSTSLVMLHILNIAERLNVIGVERRPNGEKRLIPGKSLAA
jgi:uncharacterized LabA/DUF88 family protein